MKFIFGYFCLLSVTIKNHCKTALPPSLGKYLIDPYILSVSVTSLVLLGASSIDDFEQPADRCLEGDGDDER